MLRALGASGVAIALPPLEAMMNSKGQFHGVAGGQPTTPPMRVVTFFIPNGVYRAAWDVTGDGTGYGISASLRPLEEERYAVRGDVNILTNLRSETEYVEGQPGLGHAKGTSQFANGALTIASGAEEVRNRKVIVGGVLAGEFTCPVQVMRRRLPDVREFAGNV